jgi:hypothetical protein
MRNIFCTKSDVKKEMRRTVSAMVLEVLHVFSYMRSSRVIVPSFSPSLSFEKLPMWCQGLSTPTHMDNIKRWGQRRGGSAISELFLTSNRRKEASLLQALRFTASSSFFYTKKNFLCSGWGFSNCFVFLFLMWTYYVYI